ncbi:MAG: DNA polymerase [Actinobacteria bacterium]|nr:DNA polymerase [Actinomycetota bacterium]
MHDELVFEAPEEEIDRLAPLVRREMEGALDLRVPVVVDLGAGRDWLEAHE